MRIRNFTPHRVDLYHNTGPIERFESEGTARISCTQEYYDYVDSCGVDSSPIAIYKSKYGEVEGLPEPEDDTLFIVSRVVAEHLPHRRDLIIPNGLLRNSLGNVFGCQSFCMVWYSNIHTQYRLGSGGKSW